MGCCGGKRTKGAPAAKAAAKAFIPKGAAQLVEMVYLGPKDRTFELVGGVTRERYCVPAEGGERFVCLVGSSVPGVRPADVGWFRIVGGGEHFKLAADVAPPEPEPEPEPVAEAEPEPAESEGEAEA